MTDHSELTDYLLGELDAGRRAHLDARIARDPELAARLESLRATVDRLERLSPAAWAYGEAGEAGAPHEDPTHPAGLAEAPDHSPSLSWGRARAGARRRGRSLGRPWLAIPGVALAAVLVVLLVLALSSSSTPARRTVVLQALAGAPSDSRASATITGARRIAVSILHLPATDSHHHYELWLMTSTTDLLPVGSFHVGPTGAVRMSATLPAPATRYRYLDISLQLDGAGPGISSRSLLRGSAGSS
jgi:anti-sigma-K factor RskA